MEIRMRHVSDKTFKNWDLDITERSSQDEKLLGTVHIRTFIRSHLFLKQKVQLFSVLRDKDYAYPELPVILVQISKLGDK